MEKTTLLEVCVDSYESAMAAVRGGADRLELCSALVIGGLTPGVALFEKIRQSSDVPINCLIRPRFGDFLYTDAEVDIQCREIELLRAHGADGFVVGCLTPQGRLDKTKTGRLANAAEGCRLTIHRAFDVARNPQEALTDAAAIGADTILTSGCAANCWDGRDILQTLLQNPYGIQILVGAGVSAAVIDRLTDLAPFRQFHLSGKKELPSGMLYRRQGVPMGLPGMNEFTVWQTDEDSIRLAKETLCRKSKLSF